jgi:hypothetical protein
MFACSDIYFRLPLLLIIITTTCVSLSIRRTSAPIHLTSVLGVLGTQETLCIVIAGLFERDSFDLLLPEFNKPWVIHLRETCCCSTNLCTWRPNTIYKNRRVCRHQWPNFSLISSTWWVKQLEEIESFWTWSQLETSISSQNLIKQILGDMWYVSNVSIIFDAPCLFLHHLPNVLLHFVALLCIFRN